MPAFRDRLLKLASQADGICWGYGDLGVTEIQALDEDMGEE